MSIITNPPCLTFMYVQLCDSFFTRIAIQVVKLSSILIIVCAYNSKTFSDETKPYNSHKTVIH